MSRTDLPLATVLALIVAVATNAVAEPTAAIAPELAADAPVSDPAAGQPLHSVAELPGYDEVVRTLEQVVQTGYHDDQAGIAIAREISGRRRSGRYRAAPSPQWLADTLTADLQEISSDVHFLVRHDAAAAAGAVAGRGGRPPREDFEAMPADEAGFWRSVAYGIEAVEWLDGNIGRLDIRAFARPYREVRQHYAAAMNFLQHTDALVIDLTDNGGGSVHMVGHLLSYFFDRPPFLTKTISWRTEGEERFFTTKDLEGPTYGEPRPVVVAVSPATFSGGEELAYSLQAFGRAVVVGQKTRGGANPVATWELGSGFKVIVPTGRVRHPVTGGNWEQVGVKPDVIAAPDAVPECAHKIARALAEKQVAKPANRSAAELQRLCEQPAG